MTDERKNQSVDTVLDKIRVNRRDFVRKLAIGAFAVPMIASFPMSGLSLNTAQAGTTGGNQPNDGGPLARFFRHLFKILRRIFGR